VAEAASRLLDRVDRIRFRIWGIAYSTRRRVRVLLADRRDCTAPVASHVFVSRRAEPQSRGFGESVAQFCRSALLSGVQDQLRGDAPRVNNIRFTCDIHTATAAKIV
jgi:hypothetical protein